MTSSHYATRNLKIVSTRNNSKLSFVFLSLLHRGDVIYGWPHRYTSDTPEARLRYIVVQRVYNNVSSLKVFVIITTMLQSTRATYWQ